jgi:hypothetical protein
MRFARTTRRTGLRWTTTALLAAAALLGAAAAASAQPSQPDPRVGLAAGTSGASAARGMRLVAHRDKPARFFNPSDVGDFAFANSDMAFSGRHVFVGGYNGFQVWDVANPANPVLRTAFPCPGGQGDLSVYGNLLFMSVEDTRGRLDCGPQGVSEPVSAERFRGVRIFDITNIEQPRQVAAVQTCRGSHTHTLVPDPSDRTALFVYVSGTSPVRPAAELAGCSGAAPAEDPNTSRFRIEVIRVPLSAPQDARVVAAPRVFADSASGSINGLWRGGTHGAGTQETAETDQCHDITAFPELGLAAGACSGNGILLDIRDPARPRRIAEVSDPNFAYWHSATFSNAGDKVVFTDEWGGGVGPHCRATDRREWGADAIFTLTGRQLRPEGYFKLPAAQTATENCVAHNGSLIPVPGRDLFVQAWYQGGISVMDFTDPRNPKEIAFFDRGPMDASKLMIGGFWSAYWYNGHIYGSEIGRGLDVLALLPSDQLTRNELDAAMLVTAERFNPQLQTRLVWPAHFVVARAYLDQLQRGDALRSAWVTSVRGELSRAERQRGASRRTALTRLASRIERDMTGAADTTRLRALASTVRQLAEAN